MEKITSFTIDHNKLQPGLYVSRKDSVGDETVTTFDLRVTNPNEEPVMNTGEIHAIEHLAATFLRNHPQWKQRVLYFGPMGCRTGFYLLLTGDLSSEDVRQLVTECFCFVAEFEGEVPGASAKDCGNYLDMNLPMARYWAKRYAELLKTMGADRMTYPK
ncbi:MAG: S-ribosylhomocysteine lyase [Oscillospiraceae bacterium]|nr:S-ribosylhomocysteine lyase [Oscillospiraceae bacterium]